MIRIFVAVVTPFDKDENLNLSILRKVNIYDAFINGNLKRAKEAQNKITLLRMAFNLGTFPSVIKDALELIGIEV